MDDITIYTAGEIHSEWRAELEEAVAKKGIAARFVGPQTVHERSDSVGEDVLGVQPGPRYRDLMGAGINTLRTRILMRRADLAVAYFGDKYRQWNTAADAGAAVASGIPLLLVRDPGLTHALKEIDAMASATVETLDQAAEVIAYIFE